MERRAKERKKDVNVKKDEQDEQSAELNKSDQGEELLPAPKKETKKPPPTVKRYSQQSSESSASASSSSHSPSIVRSDSESSDKSSSRKSDLRNSRKRIPNQIKQYLDIQASSQSEEKSSIDSEREQEIINAENKYQIIYKPRHKTKGQLILQNLEGKTAQEVNDYYKDMVKEIDAKEQHQMLDSYKQRHQQQMYQVKCIKGRQQELVMSILNKSRYVDSHPDHFYCNIVSAMAVPRKFAGYIFLEGKNVEDLRQSLKTFKQLYINSLKKIEFQIYSHLFDQAYTRINDFKVQQYVKIKFGAYKNDIGQITKLNKKGVVVQLIPRISFQLINLRMSQIDGLVSKNFNNTEIMKLKNQILKSLTNPRVTYKPQELPAKKKLSQSDFFIYNEFPHNKNIKITEDGLILATYSFNEIQFPKTTVTPQEILELNPPTENPGEILKEQAKKIKMEYDIRPNQIVQIISGQLKGIVGRVVEKTNKIVKIQCKNHGLHGLIIDQLHENLQKKFKEGERVVVIQGSNKGQEGIVYKNGMDTVSILTDNNRKIQCLKRNVQTQYQARINFENDLGYKADNLIKILSTGEVGIICAVKKTYVDYVNSHNMLLRAKNGEFDLISYTNHQSVTRDKRPVGKNCLVQIVQGQKKQKILRVKHVYKGFLFLHDTNTLELSGNWVEKSENCNLYVKSAPRLQAQFLNNSQIRWRSGSFLNSNKFSKRNSNSQNQNDPFKIGKSYMIAQGVYKGVNGKIVSTFKDHIQVCVFHDKIVSVPREVLEKQGQQDDRRSVAGSVASNFVRNHSGRKRYQND